MDPLTLLGGLAPIVNKLLSFIPDPQAKLEAQMAMQKEMVDFASTQMANQSATNTAEASSSSTFVAGARPFLLWVCGAGLGWTFVIGPLLADVVRIWMPDYVPTELDTGTLMGLVTGMLGLSASHTVEAVTVSNNAKK